MAEPLGPRAQARRRRILDAAARLFVRQGIERSTVDDLLTEASIARATFYRAFPSLDAVIEGLYDEYEERVVSRLAADLARVGEVDEAGLAAIIDSVFDDQRSRGPFIRVIFREELRPGRGEQRQRRRVGRQKALVHQWWEERTGVPASDDLILCMIMLLQSVGLMISSPEEDVAMRKALVFIFRAVVTAHLASQDDAVAATGAAT